MVAVEIIDSSFANERVLDVGLLNGWLFAGAGCCGFGLCHVPQIIVDSVVKGAATVEVTARELQFSLRVLPSGRKP